MFNRLGVNIIMTENPLLVSTKKFGEEETVRGKLIYPDEQVIRFIKKNAHKEDSILDFGCGFGRHSIALALDNYKNITAMDYNTPCLQHIEEESKKHNLNIKCIQNSGLTIPLDDNSVDIVIAHGSLFYSHQNDLEVLLSNIKRSMKTSGLMWCNFRTPNDDLIKKGIIQDKNFYKVKFNSSNTEVGYFSCSQEELRALFQKVGFEVVSLDTFEFTANNQEVHNSWYILIVRKVD